MISRKVKLYLKKHDSKTIPDIPAPLNIEKEYLQYLDGHVEAFSAKLWDRIGGIVEQMYPSKSQPLEDSLEVDEDGVLLRDSDTTLFTDIAQETTVVLKDAITQLKSEVDKNNNYYSSVADKYVQSINQYSLNKVYGGIKKAFPTTYNEATLIFKEARKDYVRQETIKAVNWNVRLIKNMPEKYYEQVEKVILDNFGKTDNFNLISSLIGERGEVALSRAKLIARDQTGKTLEAFNTARYKSFGVKQAIWEVADLSKRTRETHLKLNNVIYNIDEGARKEDGVYIFPSEEPQCRCHGRPIFPDDLFD